MVNPATPDQTNLNFGELKPASLAGSVTIAGGQGIVGVSGTVVKLTGINDKGASIAPSRTTGSDGSYHFDGPRPRAYGLKLIFPPGYAAG